jgi:hypothetical protein
MTLYPSAYAPATRRRFHSNSAARPIEIKTRVDGAGVGGSVGSTWFEGFEAALAPNVLLAVTVQV